MRLSNYAKFGRLIGLAPSLVEGDSNLKLLADLYDSFSKKKISAVEIGFKIAFPIANYPQYRKFFGV